MKALILSFFVGATSTGFAQNTPRYSQFNFAQGVMNPAAIAIDAEFMVDMTLRNQWFGFEGAPTTGAINAQYELYHDMAVGLNVSYDLLGVSHATQVSGQYAYRVFFQNNNALIFGVSAGLDQRVQDLGAAQVTDANDPTFSTRLSKYMFNASFGLYYHSPKYFVNFSIPQLFQNPMTHVESGMQPSRFHYYLSTGFYLDVSPRYRLTPLIQVKATLDAPIQGDLILRNTFNGRWSINAGYRTENSLVAGFDLLATELLRLGYSFNYNFGRLPGFQGTSHELYVGLGFPYHNSREEFGKRKYVNRKGAPKRDFGKGYKHRKWYRRKR